MHFDRAHLLRIIPVLVLTLGLSGCSAMGGLVKREQELEKSHRRYQDLLERQRAQANAPVEEGERASIEQLILEGDRLRDQGAADSAIWKYLQALRMDPARVEARERIGFLHLHREPQRAWNIFQDLVAEHPNRAASHAGLALAMLSEGDSSEAEQVARRATELEPSLALAWATLGTILDQNGEPYEAQGALQHALSLRPDEHSYLNNLGISYLRVGNGERAEEVFRLALREQPKDAALHNELGVALSLQGRYDDALVAFRQAGGEQAAHNNLGAVHLSKGRYDLALAQFERALLARGKHTGEVLRNLRITRDALRADSDAPPASEPDRS